MTNELEKTIEELEGSEVLSELEELIGSTFQKRHCSPPLNLNSKVSTLQRLHPVGRYKIWDYQL